MDTQNKFLILTVLGIAWYNMGKYTSAVTMACCMAVLHTPRLKNKTLLRCCTIALTVLIILATMFLKQHSVIDVVFGLTLSIGLYGPIYQWRPQINRYLLRENL